MRVLRVPVFLLSRRIEKATQQQPKLAIAFNSCYFVN